MKYERTLCIVLPTVTPVWYYSYMKISLIKDLIKIEGRVINYNYCRFLVTRLVVYKWGRDHGPRAGK